MSERIPYNTGRDFVQSGDIVFMLKKDVFHHKVISWFTKSEYIHVGIAFWTTIEGCNHLMVSEANGGTQRRIVNLSNYKHYNMDIIASPLPWSEMSEKTLERLGQVEYSWLLAGYVGVSEVLERNIGYPLPTISMNGEICSNYVAMVLNLQKHMLSPAALYEHLTKQLSCEVRVCLN